MKTPTLLTTAAALTLLFAGTAVIATRTPAGATETTTAATTPFHTTDGVALAGYDPVAYFTEGRPVRGLGTFTTHWNDTDWRFATAEHKRLFEANPTHYAPQYGGFCAWAVGAKDTLFPGSPTNWRVVNDKLYVNYNADVQQTWETDIDGFIAAADANWPHLRPTTK